MKVIKPIKNKLFNPEVRHGPNTVVNNQVKFRQKSNPKITGRSNMANRQRI